MILGLITIFILSSCSKTAEQKSEKIFKYINNENYEKLQDLSVSAYRESFKEVAKKFYDEFGEIEEFEKYDTNEGVDEDGNNIIVLKYKCKTSKGDNDVYINLSFTNNEGNENFLKSMVYSTDQIIIDNYETNYKMSSAVIEQFYDCLDNEDVDAFIKLIDNSIKDDEDAFELFINKFALRPQNKNINFTYFESYKSELIETHVICNFIYCCKLDNKTDCYEKITLIDRLDGFKIIDYSFAENIKDLK